MRKNILLHLFFSIANMFGDSVCFVSVTSIAPCMYNGALKFMPAKGIQMALFSVFSGLLFLFFLEHAGELCIIIILRRKEKRLEPIQHPCSHKTEQIVPTCQLPLK